MTDHLSTFHVANLNGLHRCEQYCCYFCKMFRLNGILFLSFVGLCFTNPTPQTTSIEPWKKVNFARNPINAIIVFGISNGFLPISNLAGCGHLLRV